MVKKTITYIDYDGTERTEDFYFNLSEAEVTEMQLSVEGGMRGYIEKIVAAKSQLELVRLFKEILLHSYGKKSLDGRLFVKNEANTAEFVASPAYSKIYMELVTDTDAATKFVNALIPANTQNQNPAMAMAATANAAPALTLG